MTTIEKDYKILTEIMHQCGIPTEKLRETGREYPFPYYRGMLAERLRGMGYKLDSIGALFGRTHATIIHSIHILGRLDAPCYRIIKKEYDEFKHRCEEFELEPGKFNKQ